MNNIIPHPILDKKHSLFPKEFWPTYENEEFN